MVEKKYVVENKQLLYEGPFSVPELYDAILQWAGEKGMEEEVKVKREFVEEKHKAREWILELWSELQHHIREVLRVRVLMKNVTQERVKLHGKLPTLDKGELMVNFDGILETDWEGKWEQKPIIYFLRFVFERYIYKYSQRKYDNNVAADLQNLHDTINKVLMKYRVRPSTNES